MERLHFDTPERPQYEGLDTFSGLFLDSVREMSPNEVVALFRQVIKDEWDSREQSTDSSAPTQSSELRNLVGRDLSDPLFMALQELPKYDLEHAKAVYSAFAESPRPGDRREGALLIHGLPRYDHELGVKLWRRLLMDEAEEVSSAAVNLLLQVADVDVAETTDPWLDELLDDWCITRFDLTMLLGAYRSEDNFDLGGSALDRLTQSVRDRHQAIVNNDQSS